MSDALLFWPAFAAGLLVAATHVPLGAEVLKRGIVFIDLAVAQMAALGVVAAAALGLAPHGAAAQGAAFAAALAGAALLLWTERILPEVQEAVIGVVFVLAANVALLLLAASPRGAEHLKDLLAGQILWVAPADLVLSGLASAAILGLWSWRGAQSRPAFYLLFACAVTVSVQLVGVYLVFCTLIVPALATRGLAWGWTLAALAYAAGLVFAVEADLPAGPVIVCTMVAIGATSIIVLKQRLQKYDRWS